MQKNIETKRHSMAHILALAVQEFYPKVKFATGPAIDNGFYYDFDFGEEKFSEDDLNKIEKKMKHLIKQNIPFEKTELNIDKAINAEQNEYKKELLLKLKEEGETTVSFYKNGDFTDLCKGPHIESSKEINKSAFKLTKVAGAYWRGDEKNKMLTRIYGVLFETPEELNKYLTMMQEALKRDHRKLSKELDLFSYSEKVGAGLVLWHPNLSKVREILETWWRQLHRIEGYDYIYTPHIGRDELWETSGHLDFFTDSMYPPLKDKETDDEYFVKPMSCPFHVEIYKNTPKSYRDLPLRWNELGTCYRYEQSGEIHGLARPRGFTQDDAHIICTKEQFKEEYRKVVELTLKVYEKFGFDKFKSYLAVRDPENKEQYVGDSEVWDTAENTIKEILNEKGIKYEVEEGGAKFYGPALDIKIFDAIGREWQCPTIQLDMNLPSKFGMLYTGKDGQEHTPIMLHRTIFGAMERFCAILIEHYAGAFPIWLSPIQVKLISVGETHKKYCQELAEKFIQKDIRVKLDIEDETVNNKIRKATTEKIPYILVIGDNEINSGQLNIRDRGSRETRTMTTEDFINEILDKNKKQE